MEKMKSKTDLKWTGERLTTEKTGDLVSLHLHRYALALELSGGKVVLDIASGEGYGSNLLASVAKQVTGVDIDDVAVKHAISKYVRNNLSFIVGSTDKIPIDDNQCDVVVSFETIEHHDKHEEMIQEIKRVLKNDGILIVSSPDKRNFSDLNNFHSDYHVKELYKEEFKKLIEDNFKFSKFFNQHILYNSIVVPESGCGHNFKEFSGDFEHIDSNETLTTPMYNICIASNTSLNNLSFTDSSIFNSSNIYDAEMCKVSEVYNSKTYKVGYLMTFPLRVLRTLFKK